MKPQNSLKIGALLVILLTNAVALGGAFWNRSGEVESRLMLSQRELRMPYARFDRENSGFALCAKGPKWRFWPPQHTCNRHQANTAEG